MAAKRSKTSGGLIAIGAAYALWGLNMPFIKLGLESIPTFALIFAKFAFGAVVFGLLASKRWRKIGGSVLWRIIWSTFSGYALALGFMYIGIQKTGGLNASLIYLLAPLLLYFFSVEFLKERINSRLLLGVAVGCIGAGLIVAAPVLRGAPMGQGSMAGNLFVVLAILTDVAGTIMIKPVMNKVPPLQMTALRFGIATLMVLPLAALQVTSLASVTITMPLIVAIGYNLIFGTLVAYYLYHAGLKRVSGEQVSVLFYIDPMVGVIGSVLILGEQFTMTTLAGVLLVIGGLYFSELRSHRIHGHFSHHR